MRCPLLVGRQGELARLAAAVDRADRTGRGSWVTVSGEAGVGKSRLVSEAASGASAGGHVVLRGRCSPTDRLSPFRPLAEVFLSGLRHLPVPTGPELGPYVAAIGRLVPHWEEGGGGIASESPAVIGESSLRVLDWLAASRVAVVVVEDLHWADPETLAVCDYLADHLSTYRVVVIATSRTEESPPGVQELAGRCVTVKLDPMGPADVATMAAACLGEGAPAGVLARLDRFAGGLPLLVEDLLDAGGAAPRFDRLVRQRFQGLSASGRRVVVAAALLGIETDVAQLTAVCDLPAAAIADALDTAAAAHLLVWPGAGKIGFRHALVRDVVLGAAPAERAALVCAAASAAEATAGSDGPARAAELWAEAGDREKAAAAWRRAATAATAAGAPESAATSWRRAVDAAPDAGTRIATKLDLLAHLVEHGPIEDALALGGGLLDDTAHRPEQERANRLLLARALLADGRPSEADHQLSVLPSIARLDAERMVVRARVALARAGGESRLEAEHLAHQAVAAAESMSRPDLVCEAFDVVARSARTRSLDAAATALKRGLATAEAHGLVGWRLRALNELGAIEMLATADGGRLRRARKAALAVGAIDVAAGVAVNLASLHAMRGEIDEARDMARGAREEAARLGLTPLVAASLVIEAVSAGFLGRREIMEPLLRRAEEMAPEDSDLAAFAWGAGRGLCALVREERADAIAAFRRAMVTAAPVGTLDTARGPLLLTLAADGRAALGDRDAARAMATPGAGWSDLWVGYGEAAFAGNAGDEELAAATFAGAEPAAARHPLFRAIALRLLAEAALRSGWGQPVAWLREAEAFFVAGGQDRIASACRGLLRQAGAGAPRRRGADRAVPRPLLRLGVTAREAEVLDLLAERLSNKEIAQRLFLSPRTVEKHVASLLSRLAAPDRAALVERARHR